jgi:4-diphosphocytidyl-2-C-methyl-D-erythritol kinase
MTHRAEARAKINLSLRVVRRREDGFHEIDTRMALITLADTLELTLGPVGSPAYALTCSDPSVPTDGANLVLKAAMALGERYQLPPLSFHLEKRVPHGAGLGGGSADAATALLMINEACQLHAPLSVLAEVAASFGSDIPFFLYGTCCDCTGRGETITPVVPPPPALPVLLIKPPFGVPTPWAYSQWRDSREIPGIDYGPQTINGVTLVNELERPVFAKYLVLADVKTWP